MDQAVAWARKGVVATRGQVEVREIFNEGYTATSGEEWMRAALCDEALRLGRMLGTDRSSLRRSDATPSPIVALNRAVAVGMAQGPAAGLDALEAIATPAADSALAGYHLLHSVRGDLLTKIGRFTEAREEIQRAITMTHNLREQELLTERLKQIEKSLSA